MWNVFLSFFVFFFLMNLISVCDIKACPLVLHEFLFIFYNIVVSVKCFGYVCNVGLLEDFSAFNFHGFSKSACLFFC